MPKTQAAGYRINENTPGIFLVSLDFELFWGLRYIYRIADCRDRMLGARVAVRELLGLFDKYHLHATWATVGLMFFQSRADLLQG